MFQCREGSRERNSSTADRHGSPSRAIAGDVAREQLSTTQAPLLPPRSAAWSRGSRARRSSGLPGPQAPGSAE